MKKSTPPSKSSSKAAPAKSKQSSAAKLKDLPASKSPKGGALSAREKNEK